MASDKDATAAAAAVDGETGATVVGEKQGVAGTGRKMITLRSKEGTAFEVSSEAAARLSEVLNGMIKTKSNSTNDSDGVTLPLPLPGVAAATLEKVVAYLNKQAEPAANRYAMPPAAREELEKWNDDLVDGLGGQDALLDLIHAAEYLCIDGLLDAACKKVANMIKGKTPEQIRETFDIPDDLTPQEKEQLRREYVWAFPAAAADENEEES